MTRRPVGLWLLLPSGIGSSEPAIFDRTVVWQSYPVPVSDSPAIIAAAALNDLRGLVLVPDSFVAAPRRYSSIARRSAPRPRTPILRHHQSFKTVAALYGSPGLETSDRALTAVFMVDLEEAGLR
jgi:hypothetical protein